MSERSPILNIRAAVREGAKLVIMLSSNTGMGKTYSAILLGYGLANYDPKKLGFVDAENRRGSLYADILQTAMPPSNEPFLIGDLHPPFSPERYSLAVEDMQAAGVEVCVVDSFSHEHEGTGGLIEIADGPEGSRPNIYWNKAKKAHKKMMNMLLASDMHIILCIRAREKSEPVTEIVDGKKKTVYRDLGLQPITEKNVMFEATASLMLFDEGKRQECIKMPAALRPHLGRNKDYLTAADGFAVRQWVDGAKKLDPQVEAYRNRFIAAAAEGEAYITMAWNEKTPADIRDALGDTFFKTQIAAARAYDESKDPSSFVDEGDAETGGADDPAARMVAAAAEAGRAAEAQKPAAQPETKRDPDPAPANQPAAVAKVTPIKQPTPSVVVPAKAATPTAEPAKAATPPRAKIADPAF